MGVFLDFSMWGGFTILWFSLTAILTIDLSNAWKFRSAPAMNARQIYAQSMMIIFCYVSGVGFGLCALIFIRGKEGEHYFRPFPICFTVCHYAAMNIYFYRVWTLYYKYKLQNEFEKVRKSPVELSQSTIPSHIRALTSHLGRNLEENKQAEKLIKSPRQHSVRNSCLVRYRWTLGRSMVIKAFWCFLCICEIALAVWTYYYESGEREVRWRPEELPGDCILLIQQVTCFIVLFVYLGDDIFLIKTELQRIYLIGTAEIVLYYTLQYYKGEIAVYLSLSVFEFCIMVAITCSNYQALALNFSCFLDLKSRLGRSFPDFDENSGDKLTMTNVLESKTLFQAFERHLKKEFSLEHLNFIVAIVHYKRLCADRNHKPQNQKNRLDACIKSREISMQPFGFTDSKTSEHALNISTMLTQTTDIALGGVESKLPMSPKYPSKLTRQKNGSRWSSESAQMLYWVKSDIDVWTDIEDTARFIFDEYCDRGAPQEINISKSESKELLEVFSSSRLDGTELCTIFDPAIDSVMDLLENDSLRRFKCNSSFDKFVM